MAATSTVSDNSCLIMSISFSLVCWDQSQASPGDHQEGREVEGDQAHTAATCLPRKGKAGHSCAGGEQTWLPVGAASAAGDVTEEQLPPRGPCRHTWLLSSGLYPAPSPAEHTAIWQQAPLWEERRGWFFQDPREQSHGGEANSVPDPESWNHRKSSRYHQHTIQNLLPALPRLSST